MKKPLFNIICCSFDSTVNGALKSLVTAINCNPILIDNYEMILEKIRKEEITALLLDEFIYYKEKKCHIKKIFKNYTYKLPAIFCLESLHESEDYHPYKQYLRKPINIVTLKNHLSPYLADKKLIQDSPVIKIGDFNFDKNLNILVDGNNNKINLTNLESRLLATFLQNFNKALSEEFLLKNVWGYSADVNSNTIKTHIWRLRKKIAKKSSSKFSLETTNKGYVLKN